MTAYRLDPATEFKKESPSPIDDERLRVPLKGWPFEPTSGVQRRGIGQQVNAGRGRARARAAVGAVPPPSKYRIQPALLGMRDMWCSAIQILSR